MTGTGLCRLPAIIDARRFAAQNIAAFKAQIDIEKQREPLPRNANGKIMKNDLRTPFPRRG